jgi:RHS repeat-associated protein
VVAIDHGIFPYARAGYDPGSWQGTLILDKPDATGTYYRRNRSYDPNTARFTQEDPIGLAGGMNLYGFAAGDPVNYSDPFGLWCEDDGDPCPSPIGQVVAQVNANMSAAVANLAIAAAHVAGEITDAATGLVSLMEAALGRDENNQKLSTGARVGSAAVGLATAFGGAGDRAAARLTSSQARDLAAYLGFTKEVKGAPFKSMSQKVFTNGKLMISQDITMHQGVKATWKVFDMEGNRLGTYDGLLKIEIGK